MSRLIVSGFALLVSAAPVMSQTMDWKPVEAAIGRAGVSQADDVYRFNFPRGDLKVTASGVAVKPAFALGGWVAMKAHGRGVMAMGDIVVTGEEISGVISALQAGGVEQTAIHHHLIRETPAIYYVHIHGHGDPLKIAAAVKSAVALTGAPAPAAAAAPAPLEMDTTAVTQALGFGGRANSGVWQVTVPRAETLKDGDFTVPPTSMGLGTAINFQPTGGGKAAITGDFVLLGAEVNPVIKSLRESGIEVTSLHNHLLSDEPRLFFMHFWANDDAVKLARGLRTALDKTNSRRPAR